MVLGVTWRDLYDSRPHRAKMTVVVTDLFGIIGRSLFSNHEFHVMMGVDSCDDGDSLFVSLGIHVGFEIEVADGSGN